MAQIQWNRYLNQLCEQHGDLRFDDVLIGCIAALHRSGKTSTKQGDWLMRQMDMHLGVQVQHKGAISFTAEQRRPIKQAVAAAATEAKGARRTYLARYFPRQFPRVSPEFSRNSPLKSADTPSFSMSCQPTIARLLLKLIDRPAAETDCFTAQEVDGGSPAARHVDFAHSVSSNYGNDNVPDDASPPLRVAAAKSDKPFGNGELPSEGEANSTTNWDSNRLLRQMRAKADKAAISIWANGGKRSYVRGHLEVGGQRYRLSFRPPRRAEDLIHVPSDGDQEARRWFEAISERVIPALQKKAGQAEGRLPRKPIAIPRSTRSRLRKSSPTATRRQAHQKKLCRTAALKWISRRQTLTGRCSAPSSISSSARDCGQGASMC